MMKTISPIQVRIAAAVFLAMFVASIAHAQPRREARERERFHTPHWVLDSRYHHNHYYPVPGYAVTVLPAGNVVVTFRGGRYYYQSGVWFQRGGAGFIVVRPPVGIMVPVLPPAYTTVWVAGVPYFYANDAYYVTGPGGYVIAQPPIVASPVPVETPPPPAPAAPPAPQAGVAPGGAPSGTWYYCESAKAYYPYVSECNEGWRAVPATPPH